MYCEIFPKANTNVTWITPNRRLMRLIKNAHREQSSGHVIEEPSVFAFDDWLLSRYQVQGTQQVLANAQLDLVWESIVAEINPNPLVNISALAKQCRQAWQIMMLWRIPLEAISPYQDNDDVAFFFTAAKAFQAYCLKHNTISRDELANILPPCEENIICYGFSNPNPAQAFQLKHARVHQIANANRSCCRVAFTDQPQELQAMLRWLKTTSEQYPNEPIACIVPSLQDHRSSIIQTLKDIGFEQTYNISGGVALTQCHITQYAIDLCACIALGWSKPYLQRLLTNPYCFDCPNAQIMAHELAWQLHSHSDTIDASQLNILIADISQRYQSAILQEWFNVISKARQEAQSLTKYIDHALLFADTLDSLNWPSQQPLTSKQHQIHQQTQQNLHELGQLNSHNKAINCAQAWLQLKHLCDQSIFQEKTPHSPIQILGLLEAAGTPFKHVWICQANDETFPGRAQCHPLLPKQLQRDYQTPQSSAKRELYYYQHLIQDLKHCNRHVTFSYSLRDNERELNPSPLILDIEEISPVDTSPLTEAREPVAVDQINDQYLPALTGQHIRGGSYLLAQQANCPFMAASLSRLKITPIQDYQRGLNALDKGTHLHKALEIFYQRYRNQHDIIAMTAIEKNQAIAQAVNTALADTKASIFSAVEKQRLQLTLQQWVDYDCQRPTFSVLANELNQTIELKQFSLQVRIDRIDTLADGTTIVIDYKSGRNSLAGWFDERLTSPQLPLYASFLDFNTSAIAYAELKRRNIQLIGVGSEDTNIAGIKPIENYRYATATNWQQQQQQWQQQCQQLADEYQQGYAAAMPAVSSQPCLYCSLKPFCRINHASH